MTHRRRRRSSSSASRSTTSQINFTAPGQPLRRDEHDRSRRSTTSTCARRVLRSDRPQRDAADARRPGRGDIATHFIWPERARASTRPAASKGEVRLPRATRAATWRSPTKYMKKAGYPSGKYNGPQITDGRRQLRSGVARRPQVVHQTLQKLGFKVNFGRSSTTTMYTKFCNVPKAKIDVCPNVGWLPDFHDAQTRARRRRSTARTIVPGEQLELAAAERPEDQRRRWRRRQRIVDPQKRARGVGQGRQDDHGPSLRRSRGSGTSSRTSSRRTSRASIGTWNAACDLAFTSVG